MDKSQLHILHLPRWYPNAHSVQNGIFIKKQVEALGKLHRNTVIFVNSAPNDYVGPNSIEEDKDQVLTIIRYFKKGNRITNTLRYFVEFRKALKIAFRHYGKPDIVHAHVLLRTFVLAYILQMIYKIPYMITEHWTGYHSGLFIGKSKVYQKLTEFCMQRAKAIALVSSTLKNDLTRLVQLKADRIVLIPNIIHFPDVKIEKQQLSEVPVLLVVADLNDEHKNISGILEAFAELGKEIKAKLVIVGDGTDRSMLQDKAEILGLLNKNVFFEGERSNSEVYEYYQKASLLILNSNFETFGMVAAEAIACHLPVVATQCGGVQDFLNEKNSFLIPKNNKQALVAAIKSALAVQQTFPSNEAVLELKQKFSNEAVAAQISETYYSILKQQ